jgi:hypothetical protein
MAKREQQQVERVYPAIEVFLESSERGEIAACFAETKQALEGLPKPKAEQGKRALAAIEHTQSLLNQLFDVKEKMTADAAPKKSRR